MGGAVSMSTASAILGGCRVGSRLKAYVPRTLTPEQYDLVADVAELIIPETDTPGARGARVHEFIDKMLTDWFDDDQRERFLVGLADVENRAVDDHADSFLDLDAVRQNELLTVLEKERVAWKRTAGAGASDDPNRPFFDIIRELTIAGYYTSEIGASQELKYEIIFTGYEGAVPYEEIGRSWS